jgi:hypothetical protein
MFKGLNVGDKIRVDYEEGAIEGTFSIFESPLVGYGVPVVNTSGCSRRIYNCYAVVKVTVLEKALPKEPPNGSIALCATTDGYKTAYTRFHFGWQGSYGTIFSWAALHQSPSIASVEVVFEAAVV